MIRPRPVVGSAADGSMLTRAEMCKALGISKSTLRRREKSGEVQPIVDERGFHLYRPEDAASFNGGRPVQRLPKARALVPSAAAGTATTSELGAEIFERLDRHVHPVDIVKELRVHPDVVEGFVARWARMRGTARLTPEQWEGLCSLAGCDRTREGSDLVVALRIALRRAPSLCRTCEMARSSYCKECVRAHVARTKARTLRERKDEPPVSTDMPTRV